MNKLKLIAIASLILVSSSAFASKESKIDVCHFSDTQVDLISVNRNA
jgi:hypothetical protein